MMKSLGGYLLVQGDNEGDGVVLLVDRVNKV